MGVVCSCPRAVDTVQLKSQSPILVKNTASFISMHPLADVTATKKELSAYVEANRSCMNKSVLALFVHAMDDPADGLSSFKLKFCGMKPEDWSHFSTLLFYGHEALKLNLWKLKLGTRGFESICGYVDMLKGLKVLVLCDLALVNYNFNRLIPGIRKLTELETLNLSVNEINARQTEQLAGILPGLPQLKKLILDENNLEDEGCSALYPRLHLMRHLELLSLRFNSVTPAGYFQFTDLLRVKDGLRILVDGLKIPDIKETEKSKSFAASEDPME